MHHISILNVTSQGRLASCASILCIVAAALLGSYEWSSGAALQPRYARFLYLALGVIAVLSGLVGSVKAKARLGWRLVADMGLLLGAVILVLDGLGFYLAIMGLERYWP